MAQTDRTTHGHGDSTTNSPSGAELVKILNRKSLGSLQTCPILSLVTLSTTLGIFFPDSPCGLFTVCPSLQCSTLSCTVLECKDTGVNFAVSGGRVCCCHGLILLLLGVEFDAASTV